VVKYHDVASCSSRDDQAKCYLHCNLIIEMSWSSRRDPLELDKRMLTILSVHSGTRCSSCGLLTLQTGTNDASDSTKPINTDIFITNVLFSDKTTHMNAVHNQRSHSHTSQDDNNIETVELQVSDKEQRKNLNTSCNCIIPKAFLHRFY
jgi:hypothetical protein